MAATEPTALMSGARFVAQHLTAPEHIERAIREIELNLKADPGVIFDHAKSLIETTCKTIFKEMGKTADEGWSVSQFHPLSSIRNGGEGRGEEARWFQAAPLPGPLPAPASRGEGLIASASRQMTRSIATIISA